MTNHKWDLKSNYMLAFTVCKYGLNSERWNLIANDLADYINTTPSNCKAQFDSLCQQYGQDWQRQSIEPLHNHVFSMIKRLYYGDLCERMTESRDLLMVMYDFIRLFKGGRVASNDINEILQDIKNTAITGIDSHDNGRQQKIKMLERLKSHMSQQIFPTSDVQHSSFPVELLPPPPFFQQQLIVRPEENDREVPSMNGHQKLNATTDVSSLPIIIQSNNLFIENERQSSINNQLNNDDVDEIELSSDDDDNDRTAIAQMSMHDELATSSNLANDQDESTDISDEQMETNDSLNTLPIPVEVSNSNDRDLYENVSSTSISNQSTFDTRLSAEERATTSTNGQPVPSDLQLHASISGSSDCLTLDSDRVQATESYHRPIETESIVVTPNMINVDDDEAARMDAEQIPEPIPADITDIVIPNDNAVFALDAFISNTDVPKTSKANNDEKSVTSDVTSHEIDASSDVHENDEQIMTRRSSRSQPRLTTSSLSHNFRKSINSILNNLKNAKYGSDFAKPLKSFKLPDEYHFRIKQPLDIPEIRERMNNGDYDNDILLFERDILLMFTNALCMYDRDVDVHGHAQYMINCAIDLLKPIDEVLTPWETSINLHENKNNDGDLSNVFHPDNDNDSDESTLNVSSSTRTPSIASTSSSIRVDSSTKRLRQQLTPNYSMQKRQRKTTH